jgi:hypothetical protein
VKLYHYYIESILLTFYFTKVGKERGNSYRKNEEITRRKTHINTRKLNWNVSTITDVFLNQKRVNACEHTVTMASRNHVFIMVPSLPCVHIHFLSSDRERHLWSSNISVKFPCVYVCLSSRNLFIFSVRVSFLFLFIFFCYLEFGTFLFCGLYFNMYFSRICFTYPCWPHQLSFSTVWSSIDGGVPMNWLKRSFSLKMWKFIILFTNFLKKIFSPYYQFCGVF